MTWFELFYDLVIVAAIGHGSHLFIAQPSFTFGTWLAVTLVIMTTLWLLTALHANLFEGQGWGYRLLILVQMMGLAVSNLSIGADDGLPTSVGLAALGVSFGSIAAMYATAGRGHAPFRARPTVISTGIAGAILVLGSVLTPARLTWEAATLALALALVLVPLLGPVLRQVLTAHLLNADHLGERFGQLFIIVLGESFIGVMMAMSGLGAIPNPPVFALAFVIPFLGWAAYFTWVEPRGLPRTPWLLRAWIASFVVLLFGAVGAGDAMSVLVTETWAQVIDAHARWLPLSLLYACVGLGLLAVCARPRVGRR